LHARNPPGGRGGRPCSLASAGPGESEGSKLRVLTVHLNQVGDLLFSMPAMKSIRDSSSDVRIVAAVRANLVPLMQLSGLADEIIVRMRGQGKEKRQLRREVRDRQFDLAVSFSRSVDCMLLVRATRAPIRAGFSGLGSSLALNRMVPHKRPPSTENNLRLIDHLGYRLTATNYVGLVASDEEARQSAEGLLRRCGVSPSERLVILAPGASANRSIKCWTDDGFAQVASSLSRRHGVRICVVGTEPQDALLARTDRQVVDLTGKTDLRQLTALLELADLLVAVDAGVMHLGAAVRTPVVALFGPTDPSVTGPQGEGHEVIRVEMECSPCFRSKCPIGRKCMTAIQPEQVIAAADARLMKRREAQV
jgi:heptosyltransferase-1